MSVLSELMENSGIDKLDSKFDTEGFEQSQMVQRYRPEIDANYNKNPMWQEKGDRVNQVESILEHADFAAGTTASSSNVLGMKIPGARFLTPHRETSHVNSRAMSKGVDGSPSFGKPRKVTRKDLYKLRGNAAKSVSLMRKMGFNGTIHGFGYRGNVTDHDDGNGVDYMVGGNRNLGNKIARHHIANRKQLGVKYVIWRQRIASASSGWKWRKMEDRGNPTANHMDHPHVSFY